ncbi:MAG: hypothetical protein WBH77_04175 [Saccharofermentanales bacterium]
MFGLNDQLELLDSKGTPIRVGFIGAGAMGMNFIGQTIMSPGMKPMVVCDIDIDKSVHALTLSGISEKQIAECKTVSEAQKAIDAGKYVCTTNADIIYKVDNIDVVVEGTGNVAAGARYCFDAILHKKHVVSLSVEMDVVIGHILSILAKNAGVVYTGIYGDEPGVIKLLYDQVKSLGFTVVAAGRGDTGNSELRWNPETVKPLIDGRAEKRGFDPDKMKINPYMFASFNDGSKTNEELTMIANATGLVPDVRGTHHPIVSYEDFTTKVPKLFDIKENGGLLSQYGVVESVGIPGGVGTIYCFVVVTGGVESAIQGLKYHGSGGPGPNWVWWEPIHWVANTAPISVAYAALYNIPTIAPIGRKRVAETITMAKKDLKAGDVIDTIGGYSVVGRIEKARISREENLLPLGLSTNCTVKRDIAQGEYLTYDDVEFYDENDFVLQLRRLQDNMVGVL